MRARFPWTPLQHCLFTPELQWQSRGKRRILQGCTGETLGVGLTVEEAPFSDFRKVVISEFVQRLRRYVQLYTTPSRYFAPLCMCGVS